MSTFSPQFQILSDLHLETPLAAPAYAYFTNPSRFPIHASNLFLLGDIGLVRHDQLFAFLRSLLSRTPNLKIFFVLGNHEAYSVTMTAALSAMRRFEESTKRDFGERFFFMDRRRVDFSHTITILGCTLWSRIEDEHAAACAKALTDFHETNGIRDRTVEAHNEDHARDLAWLNEQVGIISSTEPERQIIIITHHLPTTDPRANNPAHAESKLSSGFRTDLSAEMCWKNPNVKMWAFGHTHWSCGYVHERGEGGVGRMLVVSEQKGYAYPEGKGTWVIRPVVVDAGGGKEGWKVVVGGSEACDVQAFEGKGKERMASVCGESGHVMDAGQTMEETKRGETKKSIWERATSMVKDGLGLP
jgi:hypothetical protein